jgi:small subunit ribosomal protein S4
MGDPRRQRKTYSGPTHPWQKTRIDLEAELKKKHGYKNKKELWKLTSKMRNYRAQARSLIPKLETKQGKLEFKQLITKLESYGLVSDKPTIDEVLQLNIEDLLNRRLQTLVYKKGFANTVKQARQFIVHGHVRIHNQKITSPSHLVKKKDETGIMLDEEVMNKIKKKQKLKIKKEVEKIKKEVENGENSAKRKKK